MWWLIVYINLIVSQCPGIWLKFWAGLWGCFWVKLALEWADSVNVSFSGLSGGRRASSNLLRVYIEQKGRGGRIQLTPPHCLRWDLSVRPSAPQCSWFSCRNQSLHHGLPRPSSLCTWTECITPPAVLRLGPQPAGADHGTSQPPWWRELIPYSESFRRYILFILFV